MQNLLLSYYGDDLTGSTDVMEALELGGVPTVLFMRQPDEPLLSQFRHCRAVGLAGTSRSETPQWMDGHLRDAFAWLKTLNAEICHYKVCSTFDSSPAIGSIGRAIEIGRSVFSQESVPLVVGAPQLKRYTAFGHLFAAYRDKYFRIDRHPVMSRHPITPMDESDLLIHLSRQTDLTSGLVDLATLQSASRSEAFDRLIESASDIVLVDVDSLESQALAGKEIWRVRSPGGTFVVGSSGIEYALLAEWASNGTVSAQSSFSPPGAADRIAVVSGSCSPTTERQIRHALTDGFDGIEVDPVELISEDSDKAIARAAASGRASLEAGRSVVLYTALGPAADRGAEIDRQSGARHKLGRGLGELLRELTIEQKLQRVVIAGGDTSSHALGQMGVDALTVRMPLPASPGSPLCVAHSRVKAIERLEVALKGGQVGTDRYFCAIRDGLGV
ncbi:MULTISPECIES: four-carbon acid sugar kinase family protein [unclassified Mesorhizobium]|uniref:four-carbon acid sugar kinase family protein n=1 Tax=unclassified Mesorhizobium TaxID=325217 RepID=UPI000FE5B81F|nr:MULTISPECIES: four-carbon acid sugar kinase family protein [unclassified Mesorhizobium]RWB27305.1 MAG: four-carbon acid sugar kinase family protein [Mesorhizobium sp.]RWD45777.1 MAG: four-carbon acid sugar kinase family protein [Mesorhizobium sp.]RWE70671.1 MAG: four-carbon acid sugar kinase family protein [Mesorhizobium sp.]TGT94124.1 four-carbon acid sugar kinase family protein [Mesorhizobium sp. M5C.F.Ca.ET.164.01.1.1]TIS39451.1 MAG: four-carbon acid sugar kinase family protein [Mesorhiz